MFVKSMKVAGVTLLCTLGFGMVSAQDTPVTTPEPMAEATMMMDMTPEMMMTADAMMMGMGTIVASYTLPELAIGAVQNASLPDSISNDRGLLLGGIGSDLWRAPNDPENTFWMITDRGPNGQIEVEGSNRRTFPIPEFTPHILQVELSGEAINVLQAIPLVDSAGVAVTGVSNLDRDERPFDFTAMTAIEYAMNGLDSEGLVRTSAGDFWVADEYGPSIAHINAEGQVVRRFVPEGIDYTGASVETVDNLPALYATRRGNRGFESMALSADETTLYTILQSPLRNPDGDIGDVSRNVRILAFDIATETVTAEYVYTFQDPAEFNVAEDPDEMKISGLIAVGDNELLVLERTDDLAKIFHIDLSMATNILGTEWDAAATTPSLEGQTDLTMTAVVPASKTLVLDLGLIEGIPNKIEGIALIDEDTLAIANDNDFDIGDFDEEGNNIAEGLTSQILIIDLAMAIP